jgi:hypothetical protein
VTSLILYTLQAPHRCASGTAMLQQALMSVPSIPIGGSTAPARLRWMALVGMALLLAASGGAPASGENAEIARRRAEQRTTFTDSEIADGFFKVAFGAEFNLAGRIDRIRKFDGPVRIFPLSLAKPDRRAQLAAIVTDIRSRVDNLDLALVQDLAAANLIVRMVYNRDINRTIRAFVGRDQATRIRRSLDPQCLSGFRKDAAYRIEYAEVILPVDAGEFTFYDCAYEELLQALGPINDDPSVPWTMFNDNVRLGFFGIYDQYLLNILYHRQILPGMTVAEVRAILPTVLPAVRAFVARKNGIPP